MALGLKGCWHETRRSNLRYRLKELRWDLKYAWQRVWRGWDNRDMYNMDYRFIERQKEILKAYREKHWGLFNVPAEYRDMFPNKLYFEEDETNMILDMMIYHLEMMDEDHVEKVVYGKNIYDDDYDFRESSLAKTQHIASIVDQNKNAFMKLFTVFFWNLWD